MSKRPKPTARAMVFGMTAVLMYLFANQTQVNWLYVTSALILAVVPIAWWANRRALVGISGYRELVGQGDDPIEEGMSLNILLRLNSTQRTLTHVQLVEQCPLAPSGTPAFRLTGFIETLARANPVEIEYTTEVDRRGYFHFSPIQLSSRSPFGLFIRQTTLPLETSVLVYPPIHSLSHLTFLDRQPSTTLPWQQRAGLGNEVLGVRPYRLGDSPRHIHWKTVARTRQMMSKEFVEENEPGLSVVIDRYLPNETPTHPKHNPFEWGIKIAVSVAEYAFRRSYPFYVVCDESDLALPYGALTQDTFLQYSARLFPTRTRRLDSLLVASRLRPFTVVISAYLGATELTALEALHQQGVRLWVIGLDANSFPNLESEGVCIGLERLDALGIQTKRIRYSVQQNWAEQLDEAIP